MDSIDNRLDLLEKKIDTRIQEIIELINNQGKTKEIQHILDTHLLK